MEDIKIRKLLTLNVLWEYGVKATPEDELRKFYNGIDNPMLLVDNLSDESNITLKDLVEIPSGEDVEDLNIEGCYICLNPKTYLAMNLYGINDQEIEVRNCRYHFSCEIQAETLSRLLFECPILEQTLSDVDKIGELQNLMKDDFDRAPTAAYSDLHYLTPMIILSLSDWKFYNETWKIDEVKCRKIKRLTTWAYRYMIYRIIEADKEHINLLDSSMETEIEESAKCINKIIDLTSKAMKFISTKDDEGFKSVVFDILDLPVGENYMN